MTTGQYVIDRGDEGQARLRQLQTLDGESIGYVETLGIKPGWHVLDLGAGGGSMTDWFCQRVGSTGHVVAIDRDTQNVERLPHQNLEVRCVDIVAHDLEPDAFDLIFARLVIEHIPEREEVLNKLVAALKPGGWILMMDLHVPGRFVDPVTPPILRAALEWLISVAVAASAARGHESTAGYKGPARLKARKLTEVGSDVRQAYYVGGSDLALFWRRTAELGLLGLVDSGQLTRAGLDAGLAALDDPELAVWDTPKVYTWGRKPG